VTAANREEARACLEALAEAVFAEDLQTRILAHAWLVEFNAGIPQLLDWLSERGAAQVRTEATLERALDLHHRLEGRADRLEILADGSKVVVDYKTGARVPREAEVESGEAVQLLHYALLDDAIVRVEYFSFKDAKRNLVIEDGLADLRHEVASRLRQTFDALHQQAPLTAHGDDAVCERCDYRGLCRKGDWAAPRHSAEIVVLPRRQQHNEGNGKP
jgi:ATP-dependent helicase/nuclease subunit B